jgi:lysophospholipase L1-like esterase
MAKKHGFRPLIVLSALIVATVFLGLRPATPTRAAATRIMALGDSITGSPGCWRAILWNELRSAGLTNFEPVGTLSPQGCPQGNDGNNEGHGGFLATGIANQDQLPPWLAATNPDIVLMHLGTNDLFNAANTTEMVLAAYTKMVGQMRANNPNMTILVAQIIPMYTATTGCTDCYQRVINLNAAIPGWAAGLSTSQSRIIVVDLWTGFDTTTDTSEGVHPNNAGFQKMADKWFPALSAVLGGAPTTTPTRTATPGPSSTPTRTPTRTSTAPTATRTRTSTGIVATATPTRTPTAGARACSPVTSTITAPFTFDGAGTFCWRSSNLGNNINSWNLANLTVNGVNFTNAFAFTSNLPPKAADGFWYVSYTGNFPWSHFETKP